MYVQVNSIVTPNLLFIWAFDMSGVEGKLLLLYAEAHSIHSFIWIDLRSIVRQGYAEALEIAEDRVLEGDINNVLQLLSAIGVKSLTHIRDVDPEDLKDSLKTLPNKVAKGKILSKLAQKGMHNYSHIPPPPLYSP